ncbi:IDEAL domain-containing protein [Pueribacillus sp. YX66]|uniref:IDEAL domain-containing protein n=1 Tax=Pueribacillus sp. YX66 TaxID=3229242 RepID=UPI00358D4079
MDPRKSYDAKVRALARAKVKQEHSFFLALFAQLITDEAVLKWKKKKLEREIDEALVKGDRKTFYKVAKEYSQLVR